LFSIKSQLLRGLAEALGDGKNVWPALSFQKTAKDNEKLTECANLMILGLSGEIKSIVY
jgi:hypothetical protein